MNKDYNKHFNALDDHQDWKTIVVKKPKENVANSKKKLSNTVLKNISML